MLPKLELPEGRRGRPIKGGPGALTRVLSHLRARGFTGYVKLHSPGGPPTTGVVVLEKGRVRASVYLGNGGVQRGPAALRSLAREAAAPAALIEVHTRNEVQEVLQALGLPSPAEPTTVPRTPPSPKPPWISPRVRGPELGTRETGDESPVRLVEEKASPPPPSKGILESSSVDQTFDTYVVGPQNRFAQAAAKAVAEGSAEEYNPLLIVSGPGLGKTHLLAAIAHQVLASRPSARLISLTAEAFSNDVLTAVRENRLFELHEKLRTADLLLLDDLQFLSTDPRVQEELFHTFDALRAKGGQVVLASDRPPREIKALEERLVTRFLSGLVVEIEPPDLQTKLAILEARLRRRRIELPRDILEFVAGRTANNVRELGGALNRLLAYAKVMDRSIDLALAQEVLGPTAPGITIQGPSPEAQLPPLAPGGTYLVEEPKPHLVLQLFGQRSMRTRALAITRTNPSRLRGAGSFATAQFLWLSDKAAPKDTAIAPSLERIMNTLEGFLSTPGEGTILLDGLDYLASYNGFESVLSFLRKLVDAVAETPHVLLLSLDPKTMEERQAKVLEREMEVIHPVSVTA